MKPIDRSCLCKRQYESKEECEASIRRSGSKFDLYAYKCRYGDHWHMAKVKARVGA